MIDPIKTKSLIKNNKFSILMPVCNEEDVIEDVIEEWYKDVISINEKSFELILEDGASSDSTLKILARLEKKYSFLRVVKKSKRDGFGNAAKRLFKYAKNDLVFFTDSDGQYVPNDFHKIAYFLNHDFDIIRGAKIGRKDNFIRRIFSALFNKFIQFIFSVNYLDFNSAFFLIRKNALEHVLPKVNLMPTLVVTELLLRSELENFSIKQVYVNHRHRKHGVSRGLPPFKFIFEGILAVRKLFLIKDSYRVKNDIS